MTTYHINELREKLRSPDTQPTCTNCKKHKATDVHHRNNVHSDNRSENITPWCKRCHNTHHGISDNLTELGIVSRQYDATQRQRMAMDNRIRAYERLGYEIPRARAIAKMYREIEASIFNDLKEMVDEELIYTAYLSKIKGIGPSLGSAIIAELGDPSRFHSISALWAYCGLDVGPDGKARKRTKGVKANWNQRMRSICAKRFTDQLNKIQRYSPLGAQLYAQYKRFYIARDGDRLSKGHVDNRARRKVAKVFLACLWVAWRRIRGLPISEPYAVDKLEHRHIITPEDWAGEGWDEGVQSVIDEVKEPRKE